MLDAINAIFQASVTIYHAVVERRKTDDARREQAAAFLQEISDLIVQIATEHKRGEVPHGSCAKIRHFVEVAPEVLRDAVPDATIDLFLEQLREAQDVERFLAFMHEDGTVYKLYVTAWNFWGAAAALKKSL